MEFHQKKIIKESKEFERNSKELQRISYESHGNIRNSKGIPLPQEVHRNSAGIQKESEGIPKDSPNEIGRQKTTSEQGCLLTQSMHVPLDSWTKQADKRHEQKEETHKEFNGILKEFHRLSKGIPREFFGISGEVYRIPMEFEGIPLEFQGLLFGIPKRFPKDFQSHRTGIPKVFYEFLRNSKEFYRILMESSEIPKGIYRNRRGILRKSRGIP